MGMALYFGLKRGADFSQYDFTKKSWLDLPAELRGPYCNAPSLQILLKADKNTSLVDAKKKE